MGRASTSQSDAHICPSRDKALLHAKFLLTVFLLILLYSISSTSHAETDTRAVVQQQSHIVFNRLSNANNARFALAAKTCLVPGDLVTIEGDNLTSLNNYHIVVRNDRTYIPLKQLSISKKKIILQIPRNTQLSPGEQYPVLMLLATSGSSVSKETGTTIQICDAIAPALLHSHYQQAHESGEFLVLANSGLTDPVISEASKLGYIDLRQYAFHSINQTLLVFGGSEKKLAESMETLAATFPGVVVDYNHHFYSRHQTLNNNKINQPSETTCTLQNPAKVIVGMLDGDIDMRHPALSGKNIKTRNFVINKAKLDTEHATATAALLVGSEQQNEFSGLAPFVQLKAAKVLTAGKSAPTATVESISRAIDWFITEQVRLVNFALTSSGPNQITNALLQAATEKGLIIFASAGNERRKLTSAYPGNLANIITITAVDNQGEIYSEANQGNYIDFAAPGVGIWTASSSEKGQYRSGTSLAVPHAVSMAAIYLAQRPNLSQQALYQALKDNAVDLGNKGYDRRYGWGEIQLNPQTCSNITSP